MLGSKHDNYFNFFPTYCHIAYYLLRDIPMNFLFCSEVKSVNECRLIFNCLLALCCFLLFGWKDGTLEIYFCCLNKERKAIHFRCLFNINFDSMFIKSKPLRENHIEHLYYYSYFEFNLIFFIHINFSMIVFG